jgi:hypothetical protein
VDQAPVIRNAQFVIPPITVAEITLVQGQGIRKNLWVEKFDMPIIEGSIYSNSVALSLSTGAGLGNWVSSSTYTRV